MRAIHSPQQAPQTAWSCPIPGRLTATQDRTGIERHLGTVCSSAATPRWKRTGAGLQRLAHELTSPPDAWTTRAVIAPLKKSLAELFLAVTGIRIDAANAILPAASMRSIASHLSGLGRQLMPWHLAGAQAQTVAGASDIREFSLMPPLSDSTHATHLEAGGSQPRITRHFKRTLLKVLKQRNYLDAKQAVRLNDREFLSALIQFLRDTPARAVPLLVRNIQRMYGEYGAHPSEPLALSQQQEILQNWLGRYLFKTDPGDFLAQAIFANKHATVGDFYQLLKSGIALCSEDQNHWFWRHVIQTTLPVLHATTLQGDTDLRWEDSLHLSLNDFAWGKIHAGLLFASHIGMAPAELSMNEASELGALLLLQLQEGVAPQAWWRFFELPAKLYYATQQPSLERINTDAMAFYAASYTRAQENDSPFLRFKKRLDDYQTRSQLAHKFIERDCPHLSVADYLNWSKDYNWAICEFNRPPITLTDITQLYRQQIEKIGQAYFEIAPLLLALAWGELSEEELRFLSDAEIVRGTAHFAANDVLPAAGLLFYLAHQQRLTIPLRQDVELFVAKIDGTKPQERIYAMQRHQDGYQVVRVDRAPAAYLALADPERKKSYRDNRFDLHIGRHRKAPLKQVQESLPPWFSKLAGQHRLDFEQQLYAFGYDKTTKEKVIDFGLSILPFYTCVKASSEGKTGEAILACSIDVIALVPVLGSAALLSVRFGRALASGSLIATRHVLSDWAARESLRAALSSSSQHVLRHAVWPASQSIGKKELQGVAAGLLQALDPGAALLLYIGRNSVTQALRLGSQIKHSLPHLPRTLQKLDQLAQTLPPAPAVENYVYGRLPGSSQARPLVRLDGARYQNSHDVYVHIDPASGQVQGKKYYFSSDGMLAAVPARISRRLINLRHQGLGGIGAPQQARIWGHAIHSQAPLSYIVLHRLSQLPAIDLEISGGRRGIAQAMNIQEERLQLYFNSDGTFTNLARMKLELGEAGPSTRELPTPYRIASIDDLEQWKHLKQNPSNTVTKYLFAAVRNLRPSTWSKMVKANGDTTISGTYRLTASYYTRAVAIDDVRLWMNMTPLNRLRNSGNFALSRGISPAAFSRFIKRNGELTKRGENRFGAELGLTPAAPAVTADAAQASRASQRDSDVPLAEPHGVKSMQDKSDLSPRANNMRLPTVADLTDWKEIPPFIRRVTSREAFSNAHQIQPGTLHRLIDHDGTLTPQGNEFVLKNYDWNQRLPTPRSAYAYPPAPAFAAMPVAPPARAQAASRSLTVLGNSPPNPGPLAAGEPGIINAPLLNYLRTLGASGIAAYRGLDVLATLHRIAPDKLRTYINDSGQLTPKGLKVIALENQPPAAPP